MAWMNKTTKKDGTPRILKNYRIVEKLTIAKKVRNRELQFKISNNTREHRELRIRS